MLELDREGPRYTFLNGHANPTLSRLDQFLVSVSWFELYDTKIEKTLGFSGSDHRMVTVESSRVANGPKPSRFELYWLREDDLLKSMKEWWESDNVVGKPGYVLFNKLKNLMVKIKAWSKENFGRFEERIQHWEGVLLALDLKEESDGLNSENKEKKHEARLNLEDALKDEDNFWSQRAHKLWKEHGDKCSKLFHKVVNSKASNNRINSRQIGEAISEETGEIRNHIVDFYKTLFMETETQRPYFNDLPLPSLCSKDSKTLELSISETDVFIAISSLSGDKTPAPDGYPMLVYHRAWSFMKLEIIEMRG